MADEISFTEKEVREKLAELGYGEIPHDQLKLFMRDLDELVKYEISKSSTDYSDAGDSMTDSVLTETFSPKVRGVAQRQPVLKTKVYDTKEKENFGYGDKLGFRKDSSASSLSSLSTVNSNLEVSNLSQVTKRKVARKRDGIVRVFDETYGDDESEASDITLLEERLQALPIDKEYEESESRTESLLDSGSTVSKFGKGYLPSYIRPSTASSSQGRSRKFDPVNRYHQFKHEWKNQRVPGESRHDALRWNIREQMLNCQVYEKPQHRLAKNNYQVPTGKKRQALRWEVRCALAKI